MAIERLVPGTVEWDLYLGNHLSRYLFAQKLLAGTNCSSILDVATGVGYGAHLLSETVPQVTAVDRDERALKIGVEKFSRANVTFIKDDCETLSLLRDPFDAIVSFETLEHLKKPEAFLRRCVELLRDDGVLVLSTPNQSVSGFQSKKDWEFHEKEYKPQELLDIVQQAGFRDIKLYGQYYSFAGKLRDELRAELNRLHSNPFVRFGAWIQKVFRGVKKRAILPELASDFEIRRFTTFGEGAEEQPFVLIITAKK